MGDLEYGANCIFEGELVRKCCVFLFCDLFVLILFCRFLTSKELCFGSFGRKKDGSDAEKV
jgi:hypothetical protein